MSASFGIYQLWRLHDVLGHAGTGPGDAGGDVERIKQNDRARKTGRMNTGGNGAARAKPQHERSARPGVLYTVFAGRKNRLLLQEPYWSEMIELGAIDGVHLWDYVPRDANEDNKSNRRYLESLERKYSFVTIMQPGDVPMQEISWYDNNVTFTHEVSEKQADRSVSNVLNVLEKHDDGRAVLKYPNARGYSEYYKYYADNPFDGVIIKGDDDIAWINSSMVAPFARYLWDHRDVFVLSASVVNQGLCAHYQQKLGGAIPEELDGYYPLPANGMGELQLNATKAIRLQRHFLASEENRRRFFVSEPQFVKYDTAININFVAIRGDAWHETWELIQDKLRAERNFYDEGAITEDAIGRRGKVEGIYLPLVVVHATFSHQYRLHREIMTMWADWARRERADFYGDVLADWVAPDSYTDRVGKLLSKRVQVKKG